MGNKAKMANGARMLAAISSLPYFNFASIGTLLTDRPYSRILLSRYSKSGKIVRLKKGVYVAKAYIDDVQKRGAYTPYVEFIATALYPNSYLSMEYVLQKYNVLTESAMSFTLVSKSKTISFSNMLGNFIYHNIKPRLFRGFGVMEKDGFNVYEAGMPKALFDFIYFRKSFLPDESAVEELRINSGIFSKRDIREFNEYVELEGSAKMKRISKFLFR
jgi:predicted transcriptional regulator of viral defense system